jgi:hypothetical protein
MLYPIENRQERLRRIRREIADGQYETPERLKVAVDRLWDELERTDSEFDPASERREDTR